MTFDELLAQVLDLLQRQGRVSYGALQRRFSLDDAYLEDLKTALIEAQRLAVDENGRILVWTGDAVAPPAPTSVPAPAHDRTPLAYTPAYLAEKILSAKGALEGERKHVTVLFADIKGSTELIASLDPEEARQLLDPALHAMMEAVHRYEGTVNQVLGDGLMALFGAPLAHEDHAARACYAALAMQVAMRHSAETVRRAHGLEMQIRVGLNSGEVVVRAIGNDLHMDYMELEALHQALERAGAGHGQLVAVVGEPGVGKSRLVYEFLQSHRTQGWLILESASVSYGKATPYFPVIDLLKRYAHVDDRDDTRAIRAKVTGQVLTLDERLQEVVWVGRFSVKGTSGGLSPRRKEHSGSCRLPTSQDGYPTPPRLFFGLGICPVWAPR